MNTREKWAEMQEEQDMHNGLNQVATDRKGMPVFN